ncbi:MAG: CHAT domain-containing protein, partial [Moorea sp. SIO2B7]|nr:CHAT domain-containing protein [Moorena sp. SIO2B7]
GDISSGGLTFNGDGKLSFTGVANLNAGTGIDTLIGTNSGNNFKITNSNAVKVAGINFTSIENIIGGASNDIFAFNNGVNFNGSIDGQGGFDTLNYSAYTTPLNVDLAAIGGNKIETVIGTNNDSSSLTSNNAANNWTITGSNTGEVSGIKFIQFNELVGGNSDDTFAFNDGVNFNGSIDGGDGNNTIISNINTSNDWNLTAVDTGNLNKTINFTRIQNLTGGNNNDTFIFSNNASLSGNLSGGAGDLTLRGDEINFTGNISGIGNLTIEPLTATQSINIGGIDSENSNILDLTETEISLLQNGFNSIKIGQTNSSGEITLGGNVNFKAPLTLRSPSGKGSINTTGFTITAPELTADAGNNINLGSTNITGNLSATTTNGNITDSGMIRVGGTTNLNANDNNITLDNSNNDFNTVSIIKGNNVILKDKDNLDVGKITIDGNLEVTGNGEITNSGEVTVTGTTNLDAGTGNNITLDNANNDFNTVAISGGNDIKIKDKNSLILSNSTIEGNLNLTTNGAIELGNSTILGNLELTSNGGDVNLSQNQSFSASNITVFTAGGNFNLETTETITISGTGSVQTRGGNINLSGTNISASGIKLDSSNSNSQGGQINLTGSTDEVSIGDLDSSGNRGGDISIQAKIAIAAGTINSSGTDGDGGNVTLDPENDIQVTSINAQGGSNGVGGSVDITTERFFRATGTFNDRNGVEASISTAGGRGGGSITIRHGGKGETPFVVGDSSSNGIAGAITSGDFKITPFQSFLFTHTEGNIQIISVDQSINSVELNPLENVVQINEPQKTEAERNPTSPPITTIVPVIRIDTANLAEVESNFTDSFEEYLGVGHISTVNLQQAQKSLLEVEQATGVKPALIYAVFVPAILPSNSQIKSDNKSFDSQTWQKTTKSPLKKQLKPKETILPFNTQGFTSAQQLPLSSKNQQARDSDQLELVLVTSEGHPIRRQVGITRKQVIRVARKFQNKVTNPRRARAYLPSAQKLYQWLIIPIEKDLQANKIDNLTFVMDKGLRSLPLAALHDGNGFIVERYSVGLMPSLSLSDTRYVDVRNLQILAMGAEEFSDQKSLPAVPLELSFITNQIWQGTAFLDEDFTVENLKKARASQPFGIVHLATHGQFQAGKASDSYIQFGDSRLGLDQIRKLGLNDPAVELIVLSACRTALGDEEAELGFAGLAVLAGVKSALGSLWYVSDQGTLGLMTQFYAHLKEAPIKAEALRRAQLSMIKGKVQLKDNQLLIGDQSIPLPPDLASQKEEKFSHPYYWSGFTMIGNPW